MSKNTLKTPPKTPTVFPIRRLCTSPLHAGPRWLLAHNFGLSSKPALGRSYLSSWCHTCERVRARHAYRERHANDADHIERRRFYYEHQQQRKGIKPRNLKVRETDKHRELVAAEPLRQWLLENFPAENGERQRNQPTRLTVLARKAGVTERTIYRVLHQQAKLVRLSEADRLLTAAGQPWVGLMLWPVEEEATK